MQLKTVNLERDKCVGFGPPIPQKWACLQCRVVVKMPAFQKMETPNCARCKARLVYAGKTFRAPRRNDLTGWRKVALLFRSTHVFYPVAFAIKPPKNPNAFPDWRQRRRELANRRAQDALRSENEKIWAQKRKAATWRAHEKAARNEAK